MGDGTKDNPYTREDVLRLIEEHGAKAEGLDLSGKTFEDGINLRDFADVGISLNGIILKKAKLHDAHLEGVSFLGAHLEEAELWDAYLEGTELRGAHLEGADLLNAHLEGADLRHAYLMGAYLGGAEFSPNTKLDGIEWGDYILEEETGGRYDLAKRTYRSLRNWYSYADMHDIATKFYYREKEANRKALKWYSRHRLALELLRALFGYGEDWKRVLYWMGLVVFGSAAAYYLSGELNLLYSLYFSAVSFTALGYGKWVDIIPQGWVQAIGAAESFIGVFMMALLLVTFFRKWTR